MTIHTKKTRTEPIDNVILLEDVKRALNILDADDDAEVQDIIYAAFLLAEAYCDRCFSTCDVIAERDDNNRCFYIPFGENVTITSFKIDNVESTNYEFSNVSEKIIVNQGYTKLVIEYSCGFTELPKAIDRAIKYLVSTIFNSGQDFVAGLDVNELPLRATSMLDTEKHHVI